MSIKVFADGSPLLASEINTNLMNQSVIVTTSARTSMPAAVEGMTVYETDTDKLLTYISTTVGWQLPWNMPWGRMGSATATADQVTISTIADVTSLTTGSITYVANRRILVTASVVMLSVTAGGLRRFYIDKDGATVATAFHNFINGNEYETVSIHFYDSPTAAAHTYKVRASSDANTCTIANSSGTGLIIVEDIGPAAAPVA